MSNSRRASGAPETILREHREPLLRLADVAKKLLKIVYQLQMEKNSCCHTEGVHVH